MRLRHPHATEQELAQEVFDALLTGPLGPHLPRAKGEGSVDVGLVEAASKEVVERLVSVPAWGRRVVNY